jgi:hypothetical protein
MAKSMHLIALCVITLGMAELRDDKGKITRKSTLRDVSPGDLFEVDAEEGPRLLAIGAARLPLTEADAPAEAGGPKAARSRKGDEPGGDGDPGGDTAGGDGPGDTTPEA